MKKRLLLTMLLVFSASIIFAQSKITGKVTMAENGSDLPGVSVSVKGTTRGTTSAGNGNYTINASPNETLVFTFVGFKPLSIKVGNRSVIDVQLESDVSELSEVVVMGYGSQSKKVITGAVTSVSGKEIATQPVQSFDQGLQGRVSGVNITTPNGVLNNAPVIRVRGTSSINQSSSPLIVIDGMPINSGDVSAGGYTVNNPLGDINPSDIESVEILKDASATAIYGSRAAAGVMLITTKKGKEGKAKLSYDTWVGATQTFRRFKMLDAQQFMDIKNEASRNAGLADQFFPSYNADGSLVNTNWYDYIYQTGYSQSHNLSLNGGNKDTKYSFSVGYTDQNGMLKKNTFSRMTGRMNVSHRLTDFITIGSNITYANSFNQAPNTGTTGAFSTGGLGRLPLVLAPNVSPYNADGSYNINRSANNLGLGKNLVGPGGYYNPLPDLELSKFTSENAHLIANIFADFKLYKGLVFRTSYGMDNTQIEDIQFSNPIHGEAGTTNGSAYNTYTNIKQWNWQNYLTYDFNVDKNSFTVVVGTEAQKFTINRWGAGRTGVSDPFFTSFQGSFVNNVVGSNYQSQNGLLSYFGRLNYDFDKKYLASFTLRSDGYSAYAVGNKWGSFPGASLGWRLSEEAFWKGSSISNTINELKLRGSWGRVGNTGVSDFASLSLFGSGLYGSTPTWAFAQAGNPNLRWEQSTKVDVGISYGLFKDRITGELNYYQNNITDLVLAEPQAPSRGVPNNSINTNVGSMVNKGVEFTLNALVLEKKNFTWNANLNISTNSNEVLALANNNADIIASTGGLESSNIVRVGYPVGSIFVIETRGVNPANGQRIFVNAKGEEVQYSHPGKWTYVKDGSTAPAITGSDRKVWGTGMPTFFGGFDNTFKYKQFDLGIFMQFSGGNYIYNGTKAGLRDQRAWNNHDEILNRWQKAGDVTNIPRLVFGDNVSNGSANPISENVEKGDFIRMRNISLGYTFKKGLLEKAKISSARLYAQVQNAFLITGYTGADPEISTNRGSNIAPGVDRNSTPQARTYTVGLSLNF
ncbi:SusC/RagA family TonB-linked outer membrane protein [Flectobacillus rivi]|uniref:TonB-dependent receptor n=1 Tax=Flectobacillus rivi TaxID=2984209 RepID=A0ABT6Z3I2_9BACT|nr:TonB-dependent receptor [Flectobacillus rivi]MDI9875683.1 TonB-dependent receptor [Flectobacillus rivi]